VNAANYPSALQERLGRQGSGALAEVLTSHGADTVIAATEIFEHRLGAECDRLRAEMGDLRAALGADLRQLRYEMGADFRVEVANVRADLLKWSFFFWTAQLAAIGGVIAVFR